MRRLPSTPVLRPEAVSQLARPAVLAPSVTACPSGRKGSAVVRHVACERESAVELSPPASCSSPSSVTTSHALARLEKLSTCRDPGADPEKEWFNDHRCRMKSAKVAVVNGCHKNNTDACPVS